MIGSGLLKAVHAGGDWVWITKSCPHWGLASEDYARGCHVYIQRHLEANTEEQLLCQRENCNRADPFAVEVTLGYSALNER